MRIETNIDLTALNTFALPSVAKRLLRIRSEKDACRLLRDSGLAGLPRAILGGGSNVILPPTLSDVVLKVEISGKRLLEERPDAWMVEVGAGEVWHDVVAWTIAMGWPGLENLALIPGTAGAAPIQNIGAYGVELKERFDALDAVDLETGQSVHMAHDDCGFGYRESVFKRELAGRYLVTRIRLRLPKPWRPAVDYPDLQRRARLAGRHTLDAQQVFDWVCAVRKAKLPDPADWGNAGSFFKNPVVGETIRRELVRNEPEIPSFPQPDGTFKLSAGWMIEACGWKGRCMGNVGVYEQQALVLVNRGGATAAEVFALAAEIRESVRKRFGVTLEMEPTQL